MHDVGNTVETAARMYFDFGHAHIASGIGFSGDTDWFKIRLVAGVTYDFDAFASSTAGLRDPVLQLRGPRGNVITSDDDSGAGLNARIADYTSTYTGFFYLSVGSYGAVGTGNYNLAAHVSRSHGRTEDPALAADSFDFDKSSARNRHDAGADVVADLDHAGGQGHGHRAGQDERVDVSFDDAPRLENHSAGDGFDL